MVKEVGRITCSVNSIVVKSLLSDKCMKVENLIVLLVQVSLQKRHFCHFLETYIMRLLTK